MRWFTTWGLLIRSSQSRPFVAVGFAGKGQIVNGAVIFHLDPGLPGGHHAFFDAGGHQLGRDVPHLVPGEGFGFGRQVDAGLFEQIHIVVHDRGRRVEGHGQQVAVFIHIVGKHGLQIGGPVNLVALVIHQLVDRINGTGEHHGEGADLEGLQDVGLFLGPVGGHTGIDGLVVVALVGFDHDIVALGGIEGIHDLLQGFAAGTPHGVPPLDFNGFGQHLTGRENDHHSQNDEQDKIS